MRTMTTTTTTTHPAAGAGGASVAVVDGSLLPSCWFQHHHRHHHHHQNRSAIFFPSSSSFSSSFSSSSLLRQLMATTIILLIIVSTVQDVFSFRIPSKSSYCGDVRGVVVGVEAFASVAFRTSRAKKMSSLPYFHTNSFPTPSSFPSCSFSSSCLFQQSQQQQQSSSSLSSSASSSNIIDSEKQTSKNPKKKGAVPVTILAGFLGSGKTTTLQHLLQNKDNLKIGVIVNDVAAVNIDAKLINQDASNVANSDNDDDDSTTTFIDLQNGCVCCSLADELFISVSKLVKARPTLDHIVIELSGVADPVAMKNNWKMAPSFITDDIAQLSNIVTVVDTTTFGTDYMTWDAIHDRPNWLFNGNEENHRKVSELLAEQVEAADLILLNKCDIATEEQIQVATALAKALNDQAYMEQVKYGQIKPSQIVNSLKKTRTKQKQQQEQQQQEHNHNHNDHHDHDHHEHQAEAKATSVEDCTVPGCTDTSHSHSHDHQHDCDNDDCDHESHSHSHKDHAKLAIENLGITSFVYKATRPFHPGKLMKLLNKWPVPIKDTLDIEALQQGSIKESGSYEIQGQIVNTKRSDNSSSRTAPTSPFVGVLRSKGFCWFAPYHWSVPNEDTWRHNTAMYWSHAGKQFTISAAGKWWGTLSEETMKKYFVNNNIKEYERIRTEDFVTDEFQDRRQEIVFIGTGIDPSNISKELDKCLLNDTEMDHYRQQIKQFVTL